MTCLEKGIPAGEKRSDEGFEIAGLTCVDTRQEDNRMVAPSLTDVERVQDEDAFLRLP